VVQVEVVTDLFDEKRSIIVGEISLTTQQVKKTVLYTHLMELCTKASAPLVIVDGQPAVDVSVCNPIDRGMGDLEREEK
jgi:hypothetical protein